MEKKRNFSCIDELKLHSYSIGTTPFEVAKEEGFLSETESVEFFLVTLDGRFHFFDKGGNSIIRPRKDFELTEDSIPNKEYLVSLKIPDCVTRIGSSAFYSCSGLKRVTIPRRFKNTIDDIFWKDAEKTVKFEFT